MALRFLRDGYFVGKVGIGTNSPTETLHVGDNSIDAVVRTTYTDGSYVDIHGYGIVMSRTASYIKPLNDGTQALYLGDANAGSTWDSVQINAETNVWKKDATEFMRLNSSGNLGIGITNPTVKLIVADGPKATSGTLSQNSTLDIYGVAATSRTDSATVDMLRLHRAVTSDNKGSTFAIGLSYYADPGSNLPRTRVDFKTTEKAVDDSDASKTVMSLVDSGNIGIGTTSPAAGLQVALGSTTIPAAGASTASAVFGNSTSDDNYGVAIGANSSGVGYISSQRTDGTATTYNLAIQSNGGFVGVGTDSPDAPLHVLDDSSANVLAKIRIQGDSTSGYGDIGMQSGYIRLFSNGSMCSAWTGGVQYNYINGSTATTLTSTGFGIGTTSPSAKLDIEGDLQVKGVNISNQENLDVDTGTETIATVVKANYDAAFFDFVIKNGTNLRAGTVFAIHDGTNVEFTETSTNDLGDTSDVTLTVDISGTDMRLRATTTSDNWIIKSLVRTI